MKTCLCRFIAVVGVCLFLVVGCVTTQNTADKLMKLNLGMTKSQVVSAIGKPTAARGSIVNKHGQVIEVWEYRLYRSRQDAFFDFPTYYWLYFYDGKLVSWGQAGDWRRGADRIYEMRFR